MDLAKRGGRASVYARSGEAGDCRRLSARCGPSEVDVMIQLRPAPATIAGARVPSRSIEASTLVMWHPRPSPERHRIARRLRPEVQPLTATRVPTSSADRSVTTIGPMPSAVIAKRTMVEPSAPCQHQGRDERGANLERQGPSPERASIEGSEPDRGAAGVGRGEGTPRCVLEASSARLLTRRGPRLRPPRRRSSAARDWPPSCRWRLSGVAAALVGAGGR